MMDDWVKLLEIISAVVTLLNPEVKKALENREYSVDQVKMIAFDVFEKDSQNQKSLRIVGIIMIITIIFMLGATLYSDTPIGMSIYLTCAASVILFFIWLFFKVILSIYKWQFLSALKKGYPEIDSNSWK